MHRVSRRITIAAAVIGAAALASPIHAASAQRAARATTSRTYSPSAMANYEKPTDAMLRQRLTPEQYQVTQHEGTERPSRTPTGTTTRPGIYVDVVSGEPLFSSLDKFESGTGWPSFTRPLVPANVKTTTDRTLGMTRTEVRSSHADSHLGHLFPDGPKPTGQRYCMNSASMRFIPVDKLAEEGYGEFLPLFGRKP